MRFFELDGSRIDPAEVLPSLAANGFLMLRDVEIEPLMAWLTEWLDPYRHPHADARGLTLIAPHPTAVTNTGMRGFTNFALPLHTDRGTVRTPPAIVVTVLLEKADEGGDAIVKDGSTVVRALADRHPGADLSAIRLRCAHDGVEHPVFQFASPLCGIRYRNDRLAFPVANHGMSPVVDDLKAMLRNKCTVSLNSGDGYIAHNHRWLHGRTAFTGRRRVARVLGNVKPARSHAWLNNGFLDDSGRTR